MRSKNYRSRIQKTTFLNGLTIVTEQVPYFQGVGMGAWVRIGSRYETTAQAGMSHLLEHMLFKGTSKYTAQTIAQKIESTGGEFNAFTSRECTCLHLLLLKQDFPLGANILSDILLHTQCNSLELHREKKVVLQEMASLQDNPEELIVDLFFEKIYKSHGLGKQILGTPTSIRNTRRKNLLLFFKKHYVPSQIVLTVVGNITHAEVLKKFQVLKKHPWPFRKKTQNPRPPLVAPIFHSQTWWCIRQTEQIHFILGTESYPNRSPEHLKALLLSLYLGGGMSSLLFQDIREKKGLAYQIYSSVHPFLDSGVLFTYISCAPYQLNKCIHSIQKALQSTTKKIHSTLFQCAKNQLKGTLLLLQDQAENRMMHLGKNELFLGKHDTISKTCKNLDQITPEDLKKTAQTLFIHQKPALFFLGPKLSKKFFSTKDVPNPIQYL